MRLRPYDSISAIDYRIMLNGIPKSGTHLLCKIMDLHGIQWQYSTTPLCSYPEGVATHGHIPFYRKREVYLNNEAHVFILRNPRDVLVSWHRHNGDKRFNLKQNIQKFHMADHMAKYYSSFIPWLHDSDTCVVEYENLCGAADPHRRRLELDRLAEYLDIKPLTDEQASNIEGGTRTYYANHSDWKSEWNEEIDEEWYETGMGEMEDALGYYCNDWAARD